MSNFLGWFFQLFVVKKKKTKIENIVAEKLQRKKAGEQPVFFRANLILK